MVLGGGDFLEKDFSTLCRRAWLYRNKKMRASGLRAGPAFLYFSLPAGIRNHGGGGLTREGKIVLGREQRERGTKNRNRGSNQKKNREREKQRENPVAVIGS